MHTGASVRISGGVPLKGEITVAGAKNAATKLIIATLLANDLCILDNLPRIKDVDITLDICESLGCSYRWLDGTSLEIDTRGLNDHRIPLKYSGAMRSSALFVAPLLKRLGRVDLETVGGCDLGKRPIDFHVRGLRALGVEIIEEEKITVEEALADLKKAMEESQKSEEKLLELLKKAGLYQ